MAHVVFTSHLQKFVTCPPVDAPGSTVREVLDHIFRQNEKLRGYVLDDQSEVRKHMNIFVDGVMLRDRKNLSDPVSDDSELYVMQALSGG